MCAVLVAGYCWYQELIVQGSNTFIIVAFCVVQASGGVFFAFTNAATLRRGKIMLQKADEVRLFLLLIAVAWTHCNFLMVLMVGQVYIDSLYVNMNSITSFYSATAWMCSAPIFILAVLCILLRQLICSFLRGELLGSDWLTCCMSFMILRTVSNKDAICLFILDVPCDYEEATIITRKSSMKRHVA
jgi:hypothetical protein